MRSRVRLGQFANLSQGDKGYYTKPNNNNKIIARTTNLTFVLQIGPDSTRRLNQKMYLLKKLAVCSVLSKHNKGKLSERKMCTKREIPTALKGLQKNNHSRGWGRFTRCIVQLKDMDCNCHISGANPLLNQIHQKSLNGSKEENN